MGLFDTPGLSPEDQGNVNSQALMSMGAALLKAAAPSPYKNTTLAGLGDGVQGLLTGANTATDQALKRKLVGGQINAQTLTALKTAAEYHAAGIPIPAQLQRIIDAAGVGHMLPAGAMPAPAPQGGPAGAPPGLLSPPQGAPPGPAPGGMPPGLMSPQGAAPPPMAPPGVPTAPSMAPPTNMGDLAAGMGLSRYGLIAGGPVGDVTKAVLAKNLETTTEQKNVRDPLVSAGKLADLENADTAKENGKYFGSVYRGLTGSATIAAQQKPNLDMLRQIAASPDFSPGAGSELSLGMQRLAARFGINPTGAAPREVFNQLAARVLADQFSGIKSMASETGEAGGRIFKPMLDLEEKANITPGDTLAGIKAKLAILDKSGDMMMKWGDMADDYAKQHGRLDHGFNKAIRAEIAGSRVDNVLPVPEAPVAPAAPPAGTIHDGYKFKGGANIKANWVPIAPGLGG